MKFLFLLLVLISCTNRGCSVPSQPPEPQLDEPSFEKKEGSVD